MVKPLVERFWQKVQKTETCWLWTGALMSKGYGSINMGRRGVTALAPRVSWMLHYGEMPNEWVLHHCDNPRCVRPDHLFLGNLKANMDDMIRKGRQPRALGERNARYTHPETSPRGSCHGVAKLTEAQVANTRRLYATGNYSQQVLADALGIHQAHLSKILRRTLWRHVD